MQGDDGAWEQWPGRDSHIVRPALPHAPAGPVRRTGTRQDARHVSQANWNQANKGREAFLKLTWGFERWTRDDSDRRSRRTRLIERSRSSDLQQQDLCLLFLGPLTSFFLSIFPLIVLARGPP